MSTFAVRWNGTISNGPSRIHLASDEQEVTFCQRLIPTDRDGYRRDALPIQLAEKHKVCASCIQVWNSAIARSHK